ncbi:MFS transporter [Lacibacterium aquatile]|uniref:MFS transporter n=1 Tax=Lacibacterium aquatile TaxID=1168082 RepID=A0ABW5DSG8_9PROT
MTNDTALTTGRRFGIVTALGLVTILTFGSSYYLSAIVAKDIAAEMAWPLAWVVGGMAVGSLTAGLVSPRTGKLIAVHGGRKTMAGGCFVLGLGLALLGMSVNLPSFIAAWMVIGVGMSGSLYNAAFSALGRIFGDKARPAISTVTLYGGFASTVCWPLSTLLLETYGWRSVCFTYAAIHVAISVPLILFGLPAEASAPVRPQTTGETVEPEVRPVHAWAFPILAIISVGCEILAAAMAVHLISLLTERGYSLAFAVSMGMLLGPAQVGARLIEMVVGRKFHPIWTLLASVGLTASGLTLLLVDLPIPGAALIVYGAGNGIWSIARGTLPLALFGKDRYPIVMGRLARPGLLAQAAAPTIIAVILANTGAVPTLALLTVIGALNVLLAVGLAKLTKTAT